eukprot:3483321-Prymnesium_polylepis.1
MSSASFCVDDDWEMVLRPEISSVDPVVAAAFESFDLEGPMTAAAVAAAAASAEDEDTLAGSTALVSAPAPDLAVAPFLVRAGGVSSGSSARGSSSGSDGGYGGDDGSHDGSPALDRAAARPCSPRRVRALSARLLRRRA